MRQPTVSPARRRPGLSPQSPFDMLMGKGDGPSRHGLLGTLVQGAGNVLGAGGELLAESVSAFAPSGGSDPSNKGGRDKKDNATPFRETAVGAFLVGSGSPAPAATGSPSLSSGDTHNAYAENSARLSGIETRTNILNNLNYQTVPLALRQQLEQLQEQTQGELEQVNADIERLNQQEESLKTIFDTGTQFLEGLGLPSTITSVREDPEIKAALDAVSQAIDSGEGLDEAIDSMVDLSDEERQGIGRAFGREQWMGEMQIAVRNQVHNLVQNRQDLEASMLEAEDWIMKEAESQQMNMWDTFGDPSPLGRGYDVLVGTVEPWLEANFNGILSDDQWGLAEQTLNAIWQTMPSSETTVDEETGEVIETGGLSPLHTQALTELGTQLGFNPDKTVAFIDTVASAIEGSQRASADAAEWRNAPVLEPGGSGMATAIYETAEDIYADPETSQMMANSYYLHRLIQARSGGDVNYVAGGNQVGLGGLPLHTYEDLGFTAEEVEGNPEAQMEALLIFVGQRYGPGYEGLQAALSDFVHNPDTWGDL